MKKPDYRKGDIVRSRYGNVEGTVILMDSGPNVWEYKIAVQWVTGVRTGHYDWRELVLVKAMPKELDYSDEFAAMLRALDFRVSNAVWEAKEELRLLDRFGNPR